MTGVTSEPESRADGVPGAVISIMGIEDGEPGRPDRLTLKRSDDWRVGRSEIPVEQFRNRVTSFLDSMRGVIDGLPDAFGKYQLDQVTISAEVSAKGQLSLLGCGGELTGTSGLTFTFNRKAAQGDAGATGQEPPPPV